MVVFHQGCLPMKVVFHCCSYICENSHHTLLRSCLSTEGGLPPKMSSIYHNTLVDLIFLRAVNLGQKWRKFFFDTQTNQRTTPYIEAACCLKITIADQRNVFAIKNRMIPIQSISESDIICSESLSAVKIWSISLTETWKTCMRTPFEEIFESDLQKQMEISKRLFKILYTKF